MVAASTVDPAARTPSTIVAGPSSSPPKERTDTWTSIGRFSIPSLRSAPSTSRTPTTVCDTRPIQPGRAGYRAGVSGQSTDPSKRFAATGSIRPPARIANAAGSRRERSRGATRGREPELGRGSDRRHHSPRLGAVDARRTCSARASRRRRLPRAPAEGHRRAGPRGALLRSRCRDSPRPSPTRCEPRRTPSRSTPDRRLPRCATDVPAAVPVPERPVLLHTVVERTAHNAAELRRRSDAGEVAYRRMVDEGHADGWQRGSEHVAANLDRWVSLLEHER